MTTLGIDYGTSKLGIAVSDQDGEIATPLSVIQISHEEQQAKQTADVAILAILTQISKWEVQKIVLGLPLKPDGQEDERCRIIRTFAKQIVARAKTNLNLDLETDFYPEYYTTKFANQGNSRKNKQQMGDANAACYILQLYLEWKKTGI